MNENKFELLTSPFTIGNMQIKNRIVMPPMNTNFSNENGAITEQMTQYYVRRAKGGAGLIVVEAASIVPDVKNQCVQPMLYDEKYVPEYAKMVEKMHRYGAKVSIEIVHYGSEGLIGPKVSASNISGFPDVWVKPLLVDEIIDIEDKFAQTAFYAKAAGFDAITLHATHGYLIAQFLSKLYNKRTDEYGGCLENRMRFLKEIIYKCQEKVGKQFPIMVRLSGDEYIEGGRTLTETVEIASELEKAGVAAIDLSAGMAHPYLFSISPHSFPGMEGFQVGNARAVKEKVGIPVICVGGIRSPYFAEKILENGSADLIAFGRQQIADPDFANKVIARKVDEIRPCITCQTCLNSLDEPGCLKCAVNPEAGREYEYKNIVKDTNEGKVVVVGGGPAGLEAARISALRGRKVVLYDKEEELGGSLRAAALPPDKAKIKELVSWYVRQLKNLEVEICCNTSYGPDTDKQEKPDILIIATGAEYARRIEGSINGNVLTANEALLNPDKVGKRIVIIGGGNTGCEVAEYFSNDKTLIKILRAKGFDGELEYSVQYLDNENEKDVTIVEMLDAVGKELDGMNKSILKIKLKENGVKSLVNTKVLEIAESSIRLQNMQNGLEFSLDADTIILAGGLVPKKIDLETTAKAYYFSGDCNKPGKIVDAIYTSYYKTREI
jgi:2,4-dienoyl-CoA reductase-like NADH-dependent reductase (Old Yellow Enzyme family)/thioredoxin reductase